MALAQQLTALSPLDGRYQPQVASLTTYFSEFALIKNRLRVEVEYFLFLADLKLGFEVSANERKKLRRLVDVFDEAEAEKVKELEATTKHDVKAIEYYLRSYFEQEKIPGSQWLHFGLTSDDTNSMAIGLGMQAALNEVVKPLLLELMLQLTEMVKTYQNVAMLARTHGQPAVPTTFGKEILVFARRIAYQYHRLDSHRVEAKLSGAVGNFNAHHLAFPQKNWFKLSQEFITSLGLKPNLYTTQIVPPESYLEVFQTLQLINGIILDLNQDLWRYVSDGWLIQSLDKGQVGSSTMPQKINPIDFENSEGNLGLANALFEHFIRKLPVSRLQRDLSDSVVKRQFGVAFGHCLLAYTSCLKGLRKIKPDQEKMKYELDKHWEIISEGVQTLLRAAGDDQAYEKLKDLSQGKKVTSEMLMTFVTSVEIDQKTKTKLEKLSPQTYGGISDKLINQGLQEIQHLLTERAYAV